MPPKKSSSKRPDSQPSGTHNKADDDDDRPSSRGNENNEETGETGEEDDDTSKLTGPPYIHPSSFKATYSGHCFCGAIQFSLSGEPKANVFCHCRSCQRLHGAPSSLTAIYDKDRVSYTAGVADLVFYSPQHKRNGYAVPCKLSCRHCHSPVGNEGGNMMLVLPALIDFSTASEREGRLPDAFRPTFHQYYDTRIRDIEDDLPKFRQEKNNDPLNEAAEKFKQQDEAKKEQKKKEKKKQEEGDDDDDRDEDDDLKEDTFGSSTNTNTANAQESEEKSGEKSGAKSDAKKGGSKKRKTKG